MYATSDIFEAARYLLKKAEIATNVKLMAITVYDLEPWDPEQLTIFSADPGNSSYVGHSEFRPHEATRRLSDAMDAVNTRYGEFVITPGTMMDMKGEILDRIAFASAPQIE